jgi:hypothetical protein
MDTKKFRRKLIELCFCLFAMWVITTFSFIVFWYVKGGAHGLSPDVADCWHMFIFDIIPALTAGYLLSGLFLLNYIFKSKKGERGSGHDA